MQSQSLLGKVFTLSSIVSAVICALSTLCIPAMAAPRESYTWKKVRIDSEGVSVRVAPRPIPGAAITAPTTSLFMMCTFLQPPVVAGLFTQKDCKVDFI